MTERYTRYAEKKAGKHNKFYEVIVDPCEDGKFDVLFRWGRIGTSGTTKRECRTGDYSWAKTQCDNQFLTKLSKGYREVTAMEALASAIQDPTERRTAGGLPPVEILIPQAPERLQRYFKKYLDKLNVLRDSRGTLDYDEYRDQFFDLIDQYNSEWNRICKTKAHGHLRSSERFCGMVNDFYRELSNAKGVEIYWNSA